MKCPTCGSYFDWREFLSGETPICTECWLQHGKRVGLVLFEGPRQRPPRRTRKEKYAA